MSERFAQLQETQKSQAADIVKHLEDIKYLQSQLESYQTALAQIGEKQADDSFAHLEEMRALGSRIDNHASRFEKLAQANEYTQDSIQCLRTELESTQELISEDRIKRLCDESQKEKLEDMTNLVKVFNLEGEAILKQLASIQEQGFALPGLDRDSLHAVTDGLLSGPGANVSSQPQNGMAATQNDRSRNSSNGTPKPERSCVPQTRNDATPNPWHGQSLTVKGVASQHNGSTTEPTWSNNFNDRTMSSRVTSNPTSTDRTDPKPINTTAARGLQTGSGAPTIDRPPSLSTQAVAGKKRPWHSAVSEDKSREDERGTESSVSHDSARPSPAPSSASDTARRIKKAKKKEKRQQSQLK